VSGALLAIAASQAAAAQRRVLDAFRLAGATAPDRARTPEELGIQPDATFGRLLKMGLLQERPRGTFYLDEAAVIAHRDRRPNRAPLVVALVVLVAIMLVGIALMTSRAG